MKKHLIVIGIIFIFLIVGLNGCIEDNNKSNNQISIIYFKAEPNIITKGETVNLSWSITGASNVQINNNIGNVGLSGNYIISPSINTSYLLTAFNDDTNKTASINVIVIKEEKEPVINNPPGELVISGSSFGYQNKAYMFKTKAYDIDTNDSIRYNFEWNDGNEHTSSYIQTGITYEISHDWTTYGIYEIVVFAEDESNARSETKTHIIYIDVHPIDDEIEGYLLDENSDGTYDRFYNYKTGKETNVQKQMDGTYLIDSDGDANWNYIYNFWTDKLIEVWILKIPFTNDVNKIKFEVAYDIYNF